MIKVFEDGLVGLGKKHKNLVTLGGDFSMKLGLKKFAEFFPERFFNFGMGDENVVAAAAGFVVRGKIPFVVGYSNSFLGEGWKLLRDLICYPNLNVKFVGLGAGFSLGQEGVGLQATEDLALARAIPNMKILIPGDEKELKMMMENMAEDYGPTYLRLSDNELPAMHGSQYRFENQALDVLKEGEEAVIFSFGLMLNHAFKAAELLAKDGLEVSVVNVSTLKPLNAGMFSKILEGKKAVVTIEDHNIIGGLGSAVSELIAESGKGMKLLRIGLEEKFGESGKPEDLYRKYGLDTESIYRRIKSFLQGI